jgi:hypothetical protein
MGVFWFFFAKKNRLPDRDGERANDTAGSASF